MYSEVLKRILKETKTSQVKLAELLNKEGIKVNRETLNRILNNKGKAPDEEISRAIAKICDIDDRELVIEGYLENAPIEFLDCIDKIQEPALQIGFSKYSDKLTKEQIKQIIDAVKSETRTQSIISILDSKDNLTSMVNNIKITNKEKNVNMFLTEKLTYTMEDDSMQEKIPKGSKFFIDVQEEYENGDIVFIKVKNEKLVRLIIKMGQDLFLYPLNKGYQSEIVKKDDYNIIGKVSSVEIKL